MGKKQVYQAGIIHAIHLTRDLEEAAGAYKEDITAVIAAPKDLVEVIAVLHPLAVVKG